MRKALALLGLFLLSPAVQAGTCTIEDHPLCTISCTAGCIASWVEPAGCTTRCSEAAGVRTVKVIVHDASTKEIESFFKSREFMRSMKQK